MEQFLRDNFKLILVVGFVGNAVFIFGSIFYRAWKGKKHLSLPEFDIVFSEKWVSGSSNQGTLTRLGGAANCLAVELTKKALVIRPMFPFNLSFLPKIYDLEHFIPKDKIKSVQQAENDDKSRVIIEFESDDGEQQIELSLKKRPDFLRAFGAPFENHPVPSGIFT
ncbi:MAG: hypothetical protein QOJ02_2423 [Acidobacteriota bacterium]|jgi:hypothetical protein|nr:hypothetical protein [Acidobacteriota bacterium]